MPPKRKTGGGSARTMTGPAVVPIGRGHAVASRSVRGRESAGVRRSVRDTTAAVKRIVRGNHVAGRERSVMVMAGMIVMVDMGIDRIIAMGMGMGMGMGRNVGRGCGHLGSTHTVT